VRADVLSLGNRVDFRAVLNLGNRVELFLVKHTRTRLKLAATGRLITLPPFVIGCVKDHHKRVKHQEAPPY
jgi:hypothetical protein